MRHGVIAALLLTACGERVDVPAPTDTRPASMLAWLVGDWSDTGEGVRTIERWHALADGNLLGSGYAARDGALVFAESLTIVASDDGVTYVAWPAGQDPVDFRLTATTPTSVVFDNPDHDFPQHIVYTATSPDALDVLATGQGRTGPREERWQLVRVPETGVPPSTPASSPATTTTAPEAPAAPDDAGD